MGIIRQYIIKDQECGYLTKNGKFIKLLTAGKYSFVKALGYEVDIVPMTGEVRTCGIPEEILMGDKEFADRVVKNVLPDECIALRFVNKAYKEVLTKPESLFWNVFEENEFRNIDITRPCMEESLPRFYMDLMPARYYKKIIVKDGEIGLLYYDNRYEKRLETGTYYFWNYGKEVTCKIFNMKIQQLDISGQEILTADKVAVRLNVICNYRIVNPEKLVRQVEGLVPGMYHYLPMTHQLELLSAQEDPQALLDFAEESLCGQRWAAKANVVFYWSFVPYRSEWRYGIFAHKLIMADVGHVGENLYLACAALGLGTCGIGAYDQALCDKTFQLDGEEEYMVYTQTVGTVKAEDESKEKAFYSFVEEQGL